MSKNLFKMIVSRNKKETEISLDLTKIIPADDADFYTIEENDEFLALPKWIQEASKALVKVEVPEEVIKFLARSPQFNEDHKNVLQASFITSEMLLDIQKELSEDYGQELAVGPR